MKAEQFIIEKYSQIIPSIVPIPFKIVKATFKNKLNAIADVIMFSGDVGQIQVQINNFGITVISWLKLDKDIFWDGLKWNEVENEITL